MPFDYEKNPRAIEQQSFVQIRSLTDLAGFDDDQQQVVMRLVHTAGEPAMANHARLSQQAISAGLDAIARQAPVFCDVEMVRHGLTKRMLKQPAECFLNHPEVPALASERGESRSMAAVDFWLPELAGSIVLIGNAPTALFRLLEHIEQGAGKPALIIGMPVGFIGAAESKQALWEHHQRLGLECITLLGRHGGSAMTAAAFNALLRIHQGERY